MYVSHKIRTITGIFLLILLQACSIAPLTSESSAKPIGDGKIRVAVNVLPALSGSFAFGVTESTDIGALLEFQFGALQSVWIKQNIINKPQGFSMAAYGGWFRSENELLSDNDDKFTSTGYYIAPIFSFTREKVEFYAVLRYNKVHWDHASLTNANNSGDLVGFFNTSETEFSYVQSTIGFRRIYSRREFIFGITTIALFDDERTSTFVLGINFK